MDEKDALARVKADLARAWLAAPDRIADLVNSKAEPAHCGEFQIDSIFVDREVEDVEEPMAQEPGAPSQPFDAWAIEWPPKSDKVASTKLDVRSSYVVLGCPACSQAGEMMCGVCRGGGTVADPKMNKPMRCGACKGRGRITCQRCRGRGKLLRFKRIVQRVKNTCMKTRLPEGSKVPTGKASGELHYDEATPSGTSDAINTALRKAAPDLEPLGWLATLAEQFSTAESPRGMTNAKAAWRTLQGRWYEGWKLQCTTRGRVVGYFVPDTGAITVGPRLRSPIKIGALVGTVIALLVGAGLFANWRSNVAREEREAQEQHEVELRAERDRAQAAAAAEAARKKEEEEKAERMALLASLDASTAPSEVATACDKLDQHGGVPPDHQAKCGDALLKQGQALLDEGNARDAVALLDKATRVGPQKEIAMAALTKAKTAAALQEGQALLKDSATKLSAGDVSAALEAATAAQQAATVALSLSPDLTEAKALEAAVEKQFKQTQLLYEKQTQEAKAKADAEAREQKAKADAEVRNRLAQRHFISVDPEELTIALASKNDLDEAWGTQFKGNFVRWTGKWERNGVIVKFIASTGEFTSLSCKSFDDAHDPEKFSDLHQWAPIIVEGKLDDYKNQLGKNKFEYVLEECIARKL